MHLTLRGRVGLCLAASGAMIAAVMMACVGSDPDITGSSSGAPGDGGMPDSTQDAAVGTDAQVGSDSSDSDSSVADSGLTCTGGKTACDNACVDLQTDPAHCGSCAHECGVDDCKAGVCNGRLVFVTNTTFTGNLGGLAGADAKCQAAAVAAKRRGKYRAWLSLPGNDAASRLEKATVPYRLTNGANIANNWADLTDGTLLVPFNATEDGGASPTGTHAWTFTHTDGTAASATSPCSSFSATSGNDAIAGSVDVTNDIWTFGIMFQCNTVGPLYCFEQQP